MTWIWTAVVLLVLIELFVTVIIVTILDDVENTVNQRITKERAIKDNELWLLRMQLNEVRKTIGMAAIQEKRPLPDDEGDYDIAGQRDIIHSLVEGRS